MKLIRKVQGEVIQVFEYETGEFISQEFVANDSAEYDKDWEGQTDYVSCTPIEEVIEKLPRIEYKMEQFEELPTCIFRASDVMSMCKELDEKQATEWLKENKGKIEDGMCAAGLDTIEWMLLYDGYEVEEDEEEEDA